VAILPKLSIIINTTSSSALPRKESPFFVWYGRKPHWIEPSYWVIEPLVEEDNDEGFQSNSEDLVLTEIETRVAEYNVRQRACIVKQS
jgi:hypothetical protein